MTTKTTSQFKDWVDSYSNIERNSVIDHYLPIIGEMLNQAGNSKNVENKKILSDYCSIIIEEIVKSKNLQKTKRDIKSKFSNLTEKMFKEDHKKLPEIYSSFV